MRRVLQGVVFGVTVVLAGAAAGAEKPAAAPKAAAPAQAAKGRSAAVEAKGAVEAKATFAFLKTLAGEWEGQVGEGKDAVTGHVRYRVASGGTVVEETLMPGTPHEMISLYHLDGSELLLTHYCSSGNQPRLRLDRGASTPAQLRFTFVDGTNLDVAKDHHIHGLTLSTTADGLHHDWMAWMGGKEQHHLKFALRRKGATAATPPAAEAKPAAAGADPAHH